MITWLSQHSDAVERYLRFAKKRGSYPVQLALAWVRYSPGVSSTIVGVSSLGQLQASINAFEVNLTADEYEELTFLFDSETTC